jgi:protein-disulfide isomerase
MIFPLRRAAMVLLLLLPALSAGTAAADEFSDAQKAEIGAIVRQYLLDNPEVLVEVSQELEKRQQEQQAEQRQGVIGENAASIFRGAGDLVAGNPEGDVTVVEFFDYNCSWCKRGLPEILALIEEDKNVRLVMKEFPIFGADSEYAARAALASAAQGKYWEFHLALLGHEGKVSKQTVDEIAAAQGLDVARLKADMEKPEIKDNIERNRQLGQAMAIEGTPAFIVDGTMIPGYVPKSSLAATIAEIRKNGGCTYC